LERSNGTSRLLRLIVEQIWSKPIGGSAILSSKIVKGATLKVIPGAPHGMSSTLKDQINQELLSFFGRSGQAAA
jgi:hypothetical protein